MKDEQGTSTAQACGAQVASNAASVQPLYQQIKLALDVHAGDLMVVHMVDGAKPQPPQKMTIAGFLEWVASKQRESCTETSSSGGRIGITTSCRAALIQICRR